jgi:hypothetical protein
MRLPLGGVGGVAAPTPGGPIGRIVQRVLGLRDLSPTPAVLKAAKILEELKRAEEAERRGVSGELLDQVIAYLDGNTPRGDDIYAAVERIKQLAPAATDVGYC